MGNRTDAISQKRARLKGYYASDLSECKYKYGGAWWRAWMDGYRAGHREPQNKKNKNENRRKNEQ